jgi:hypothetical protein
MIHREDVVPLIFSDESDRRDRLGSASELHGSRNHPAEPAAAAAHVGQVDDGDG